VTCNNAGAVLPAAYQHVVGPQTIPVGDTSMRVAGRQTGDSYVVVGQTTASVSQAQGTIVLAEAIVGPLLLLAVLLGALAIGRRVAAPLERAQARQLAFTADASHELRTPLSVIEAQATLALAQDRDAAWYRAAFERVTAESRRMRRLVESMLWLARFDAQSGHPRDEEVDLGVLAERAVDRFDAVAQSRRVEIRARAPSSAVSIAAPADWIDQLLGVLVDNACRYAPEGGHVMVRVVTQTGRAGIVVEDDGEVFHRVEGLIMQIGAPFVPIKHEGVIYVRPPVG